MLGSLNKTFSSLNLSLWLTLGVMLFLGIGSFSGGENSSLNDMPLFSWLHQAPFRLSWWLWIVLALIALLVTNTLVCSIESLRSRIGRENFLSMTAPQVMHAGFLAIVAAHLFSASGSMKQSGMAPEGMTLQLPGGEAVTLERISVNVGKMGMVTDFSAVIRAGNGKLVTIGPNRPYLHGGYGLYLKHVEPFPERTAYLELHREPGSGIAFAGAIVYMVGNIALIMSRRRR